MQLIDLILNGRFSVTTWIMKQGPGTLLSFISITPTPVPSSVELAFKSGSEILSIYWNEQTTEWIQTPEFDSSWKLLTFIFNFISDDSSIEFQLYADSSQEQVATLAGPQVPYHDNSSNIHYIGKSHAGLNGTYNGYFYGLSIYNSVINPTTITEIIPEYTGLNLQPCEINEYWDGTSCQQCHSSCTHGCVRYPTCNLCYDLECSDCDGFSSGRCDACDNTGFAEGSGSCDCVADYTRVSADNSAICSECTVAFQECVDCTDILGPWYDNCGLCQFGFYLQPDVDSCMPYCPSGSSPNRDTGRCSAVSPSNSPTSEITFTHYGTSWTASPYGSYTGGAVDGVVTDSPLVSPHRGLYFDGTNTVRLSGIVINSHASFIIWTNQSSGNDIMLLNAVTPSPSPKQVLLYTTDDGVYTVSRDDWT